MVNRILHSFILFVFFILTGHAQEVQKSYVFDKNIKTVQIQVDGISFSNPVLYMNGGETLKINFDELSHETKSYAYKINHCNADWTTSNIAEYEYMDGLNWIDIDDYQQSVNTLIHYTHYQFNIPNEDIQLKASGNYIVTVFNNDNPDVPCFTVRFSVVEQIFDIDAQIRTNTDLGSRSKYQQVEFDVYLRSMQIQDPFSELKVVVKQNRRNDNEVKNIKPTFIANDKLSYTNNKALVFEAGNEYRSLDISNIRILDPDVNEIKYIAPYYHVDMFGAEFRSEKPYSFVQDVNGRYIINLQRNLYDKELEADYLFVHFTIPTEKPFLNGNMYITGDFNFQELNDQSRMQYIDEQYVKSILLKQGGYNYQYLFLPKGSTKATTEAVEGNYWETENEYEIFIYYRPRGERYDRLIGYKLLNSNK